MGRWCMFPKAVALAENYFYMLSKADKEEARSNKWSHPLNFIAKQRKQSQNKSQVHYSLTVIMQLVAWYELIISARFLSWYIQPSEFQ